MSGDDKTILDPNQPGSRMRLGPYEALEVLGRGGMAVVYRGIQQSLGRVVAIKVLPKEFSRDRQFVGRFHREAESVAKLNHPNIIQIIDKGEDQGTCYFVMEYVKGQSLGQKLAAKGVNFKELVQIVLQVCGALHYAHEMGVVHRDIKPANILIDEATGTAKVADFGIAQLAEKSTNIGTLTGDHMAMGTLDYMAPEQKRDAKHVDRRADVYSLGVMLYEMATGRVPMGIFDPPSKINKEIGKEFDAIVMKCLRDKPDERFQSCLELANALASLPQSPSTMVRIVTSVKSAATAMGTEIGRRNPRYIAALLFLAAGLGVGGFFVAKYAKKDDGAGGGGATAGTGTGTTGPATDNGGKPPENGTKPVDTGEAEKRFRDRLQEADELALRGKYSEAASIYAALQKEAKGPQVQAVAEAVSALQKLQEQSNVEDIRRKLGQAMADGATQDDCGVGALTALLAEAKTQSVPAELLADIKDALSDAKAEHADALAKKTQADKRKAFSGATAEAIKATRESRWKDAEKALDLALDNAQSAEDRKEVADLTQELTRRQTAANSKDENRKKYDDALAEADSALKAGRFSEARKYLAKAEGLAEEGPETDLVQSKLKEVDKRQQQATFAQTMQDAAAAERDNPEGARRLYEQAAEEAPNDDLKKEALAKADEIRKRQDRAARDKEYDIAIKAAREAQAGQSWVVAKARAGDALRARPGDAEALRIQKEAEEGLKARPVDTPGKGFTLRYVKTLPGTFAGLNSVGVDSAGAVYAVDTRTRMIFRFNADGSSAGSVQTAVARPDRLIVDSADRLWITDAALHNVNRVDARTGQVLDTVGAAGKTNGQLYVPADLEALPGGDIVVVDQKNFRLQRFTGEGDFKAVIGRTTDKAQPYEGECWVPAGVAVDEAGNIYFSDRYLKTLQKLDTSGRFTVIQNGIPGQIADIVWRKDRIYSTQLEGCKVVVYGEDGQMLASWGKPGKGAEDFNSPTGIAVSRDGKVYVADAGFRRIFVLEEAE